MQFNKLSVNDLKIINQRTIERLRSQRAQGVLVNAEKTVMENVTANAHLTGAARTDVNFFANSQNAKFTRDEIRNALIAAYKKINERT